MVPFRGKKACAPPRLGFFRGFNLKFLTRIPAPSYAKSPPGFGHHNDDKDVKYKPPIERLTGLFIFNCFPNADQVTVTGGSDLIKSVGEPDYVSL